METPVREPTFLILTALAGGELLAAETERMRRNVAAATARLRATRPAPRLSGGLA